MKKILSFVAAALVAFSFTACNGNDPASKDFKITISDVTASTAKVKIEPADTTATYLATYLPAEIAAPLSEDSLKIVLKASLDYAIAMYKARGSNVTYADFLEQGVQEGEISDLSPKTEYLFVAVKMDAQAVFSGNVAKKAFTTPDIVVTKTVELGVLDYLAIKDYRDVDGSFMIYGGKEGQSEVGLNIFSEGFAGHWTEEDLDLEYSYVWTPEAGQYGLSVVKAELAGVEDLQAQTATIGGWVVATDQVKYTFSINDFSTVINEEGGDQEASAPKKAAKKAVKNAPAYKFVKMPVINK